MSISRRTFLRGSLGVAASVRLDSGLSLPRDLRDDIASPPPYGSGNFGRWSEDEFGAPVFVYTANQTVHPHAAIHLQPGILAPTEHVHQVGNDRITAIASNFGTVRVRQDEGCPKILNDIDPGRHQFGGGIGYLTDGEEMLSTYYDGFQAKPDRIFGLGYFRKRAESRAYRVDQFLFAPFGDDPVLISQVTVTNLGHASKHLRWIEYWGCQPYQLSYRSWIESNSNAEIAYQLRQDMGRRFVHDISTLPGGQGLIDRKRFTGRSPEDEAAWQRAHRREEYGFDTGVQPLRPGTDYETDRIPDTFLVALGASITAYSCSGEAFFGAGGPAHPQGLEQPLTAADAHSISDAAMLLESSFELAPGASRTLYFLYGYLPSGAQRNDLIAKYSASAPDALHMTVESWLRTGIRFEVTSEPWIHRETTWNHYYLRSAMTYDDFFGEHILNQNGFYQYVMGFQAAARDPLQHALPFLFSNPEIVKGVVRYALKEVRDDGSLPYAIVGHGVALPTLQDQSSDLPLWLLWAASEYVLATRDTAFLDESIPRLLSTESSRTETVRELLRRCFEHQVRDVGVGIHGIARMLVDDWNDGLTFDWAETAMRDCIENNESVLNSAMSAWVFDDYARMLRYAGDSSGMAEKAAGRAAVHRKAVAAQWNGKWFKRAWLGEKLGWLGDTTLWIEPQPWAILAGVATPEQTRSLVGSIDAELRRGPLGAWQMSDGPDMIAKKSANRGTLEMGAIWPSLNQTLVWALAGTHPTMAWDEWKRNSLAQHAEAYPDIWYGVWNGNDSWNTTLNSNPGGAADQEGLRGIDFPVLNLHAHACSLYSATKLLGLEFTENGLTLNLNLPEKEYRLESPLVGVRRTGNRFEGWYKPSREGHWTIQLTLPDEMAIPARLSINGKASTMIRDANGRICIAGNSTPTQPLRWALS